VDCSSEQQEIRHLKTGIEPSSKLLCTVRRSFAISVVQQLFLCSVAQRYRTTTKISFLWSIFFRSRRGILAYRTVKLRRIFNKQVSLSNKNALKSLRCEIWLFLERILSSFDIISEHIDEFISCWHEFKNSDAIDIGF